MRMIRLCGALCEAFDDELLSTSKLIRKQKENVKLYPKINMIIMQKAPAIHPVCSHLTHAVVCVDVRLMTSFTISLRWLSNRRRNRIAYCDLMNN